APAFGTRARDRRHGRAYGREDGDMTNGRHGPRFAEGFGGDPHPLEAAALWILGVLALVGALVWAAGELSGRLFGGAWPKVGLAEMGAVLGALPRHTRDPASAWPASARPLLPGPAYFYGTLAALLVPVVVIVLLIVRRARDRHVVEGTARWARPTDLRLL